MDRQSGGFRVKLTRRSALTFGVSEGLIVRSSLTTSAPPATAPRVQNMEDMKYGSVDTFEEIVIVNEIVYG